MTLRTDPAYFNVLLGAAIGLSILSYVLKLWTGQTLYGMLLLAWFLIGIAMIVLLSNILCLRSESKLLDAEIDALQQQIRARIDMLRCDDIK